MTTTVNGEAAAEESLTSKKKAVGFKWNFNVCSMEFQTEPRAVSGRSTRFQSHGASSQVSYVTKSIIPRRDCADLDFDDACEA